MEKLTGQIDKINTAGIDDVNAKMCTHMYTYTNKSATDVDSCKWCIVRDEYNQPNQVICSHGENEHE